MNPQLANRIVGIVARLRRELVERVRDANATSEQGVAAAGTGAGHIVAMATTFIERTAARVSTIRSETGISKAVEAQTAIVDRFARGLSERAATQRRLAQEAFDHVGQIRAAGLAVEQLTIAARVLSINARIEAARLGESARGLNAIAQEMNKLAQDVARANAAIGPLAEGLAVLLPEMQHASEAMHTEALAFRRDAQQALTDVERSGRELGDLVVAISRDGSETVGAILANSQAVMSHLQFQDVTAQSLLALDRVAREAEVEVADVLDAHELAAAIAPPAISFVGSGTASRERAGEVMLF